MTMYVVLGKERYDYDAEIYVVGVYSTEAKAQAIIDGVGKGTFPNDEMWLSEYEVDAFVWNREYLSKLYNEDTK